MADSFRAIAASKRLAAAALEARFDHLTSGPPSPRKPKPRSLTKREQRDQDFRIACGAFVKGAQKAGAKLYADIQAAEKLLAAVWKSTSASGATPSSRHRFDGVEDDATNAP